ncbi:MAG: long-chain acyl-CoA synthetase [Saprospiraceae bacterium]|jgi:long-chain acyl-CoA synthetase
MNNANNQTDTMDRFWLKSYPEGVNADIEFGEQNSITDFLLTACELTPDHPAFTNFGTTLSFAQTNALSLQFAAFLQNDLQLKKGDRLAIMLPNILQYPIVLFAALRLGITVVNVDPMYTSRELIHQLNNSGASTLIFLEHFAKTVEASLPETQVKHVISTTVGEMLTFPQSQVIDFVIKYVKRDIPKYHIKGCIKFDKALKLGQQSNCEEAKLSLDDIAFLQYTGGTTGVSKGAILSHRNIVANVLQATQWLSGNLARGKEKAITALPIYHIFSMTANVLFMMSLSNENILITNPRDFKAFVKLLKKTEFSTFIGVNTLFRKLLNTEGFKDVDFSKLKLTLAGGMSVTDDVAKDWQAATHSVVVEAYGLTETSPAVCINPLNIKEFKGEIGLPIPSTYVQIKDEDGNDLGINQQGELCVKGPQVTQGYWQRPDVNDYAFTQDGYFKTGDFATINKEGYVKILDRKKDMILVSGFNVFPNEIENIVSKHPKILEAAAIGIPDDSSGEVVKLFVAKSDPSLSRAEVDDFCRENLTAYKCPKEIIFVEELPKSNVGKILRKDLR